MDRQYEEVGSGCGPIAIAYLLGSYLVAGLAVVSGTLHWSLLLAPLSLPVWLVIGIALIGNSEIGTTGPAVFVLACVWALAVVGCWGLLRCRSRRALSLWPLAVLAAAGGLMLFMRLRL